MKNTPDLMNSIAKELNCEYLSDLHAPNLLKEIKQLVKNYNINDYSFEQWCDAVNYILNIHKSFTSSQEAKDFLIKY